MEKSRVYNILITLLTLLASALAAWLFVRFLLPAAAPFLLAILTAGLTDPVVSLIRKKTRLPRPVVSTVCTLVFLLSICGVAALLVVRAVAEAAEFLQRIPSLLSELNGDGPGVLAGFFAGASERLGRLLPGLLDGLRESVSGVPDMLAERLLGWLSGVMSATPKTVFSLVIYVIASFFLSAGYGGVKAFILRQIPKKHREKACRMKSDVVLVFEKWLLAEASLMAVTFSVLCIAFLILGVEYAALLALVTALVDALPVLGTGIVLLPWAAFELLTGNTVLALGLAVTYCAAALLRSFLEPKLVGGQVGLSPIATLLAMYTGFRLCGVGGMLLFPLGMIMLKLFNDKGYIRLWR